MRFQVAPWVGFLSAVLLITNAELSLLPADKEGAFIHVENRTGQNRKVLGWLVQGFIQPLPKLSNSKAFAFSWYVSLPVLVCTSVMSHLYFREQGQHWAAVFPGNTWASLCLLK